MAEQTHKEQGVLRLGYDDIRFGKNEDGSIYFSLDKYGVASSATDLTPIPHGNGPTPRSALEAAAWDAFGGKG